jgi:2-oxoglutarate dehydrogenase E1 component
MKSQKSMQDLRQDSYLSGADDYLDNLYETYLKNPQELAADWRDYFDKLAQKTTQAVNNVSHADVRDYFAQLAKQPVQTGSRPVSREHEKKQEKVIDLIFAYRGLGHLRANIDPLGLYKGMTNPTLDPAYYGFTEADSNTQFDVGTLGGLSSNKASFNDIYQTLRKIYCGSIGIEYMYITQLEEVSWIQHRMEHVWPKFNPAKEEKIRILKQLVSADGLERYIGTKYVGQKRFSLEGGDSLIPLLDVLLTRGSADGIKEIIIGMAHRGRLNVLVNVLGKEPAYIFAGFEGKTAETSQSGDVKYHMGFSSNIKTKEGSVHLALAFNPSHLEIISPVVQGSVRSRQRRRRDTEHGMVMPIQIHGDAAFAGQGVVMETFSMSQARWFCVGGSVHIVINNQVGFTISNPKDARSGLYCTDVAKMVQAPVLHVNANDPEAVFFAAQLAVDYRNKFKKDIVIDLVCYRRHGHNEADEPSATQPLMYKIIKQMPTPAALYANKLIAEGVIDDKTEAQLSEKYRQLLEEGKSVVELIKDDSTYEFTNSWAPFIDTDWRVPANTGMPAKQLTALGQQLEKLPAGFVVQPQVKKMLEARSKMTAGELPINWGYAETMAYAGLLIEGYPIRLCGQDAGRGTFAHRHAVLHDQNTDEIYIPLSHIEPDQKQINLVDSLLSEEAVLAFEYGFASAEPNNLVIWEAQFGDFANGAQVVVDQFLSSGEQKWGRLCGLVMLLPHGYEGAGPEHSSARLERYLQLCAQHNMQVCVPTTPAQIFHLLRRQMIRPYRKPLIVMTPKSLLRHPLAVSSLADLEKGQYQLVIPEIDEMDAKKVDRLVLCCGKVYYDLLEKRRELGLKNVTITRVEQLYPFPEEEIRTLFDTFKHVKNIIWCQEEPENQGAWYATKHNFEGCLNKDQKLSYAGRTASASTAAGYMSTHVREQEALVKQALGL